MKKKSLETVLENPVETEDFLEANGEGYDDDDDNANNDYNDIDFDKDNELVQKIKQINGIKSKRLRTEVVNDELDVNMTSTSTSASAPGKNRIKAHELIDSLKNVSNVGSLKKLISKAHKRTKVLETPLPTHISEKAHRIAAYTKDSKEVSKWDPIVKRNRIADQLVFPLKQPDYTMKNATEFVKTWKPETDLEKEVAELLQSSENYIKDQKVLTPAELKAVETMSLDELKEKRAEFLKFKALQVYQEAKFKRLKKIKSKRYRKVLRKEKQKIEQKELEKVSKEDPEKMKEKIELMEKQRMQERMSLRHKSTSKWAKQQVIYGKFNLKARDEVQEQLELSRQLTKKLSAKKPENDSDDDENEKQAADSTNNISSQNINLKLEKSSKNPWISFVPTIDNSQMQNIKNKQNYEQYVKPKAFVDKNEIEAAQKAIEQDDENDSDSGDNFEIIRSADNNRPEKELDESDSENEGEKKDENKSKNNNLIEKTTVLASEKYSNKPESVVDKPSDKKLKEHIDISKVLIADNDEIKEVEDEICDNDNEISGDKKTRLLKKAAGKQNELHRLTLSEAFADDDVVAEFKMEKRAIEDKEKVKSIDLTLPGWGDWAGAGIDQNKRNKRRYHNNRNNKKRLVIHPPANEQLRRDKDLENVIISEKKDAKIAEFQISELPHQFDNVADFEKRISQPIGRTWNPESKYRKLVQPKVVTRIGSIIEPIEKEDVNFNNKKKKK